MFSVGTKLKESIFKNKNQINSLVTTRAWVLSIDGPEHGHVQDSYSMQKWWWSSFVWMLDVVLQGVWVLYRINKDEGDESLLDFREMLSMQFFWNIQRKANYPSILEISHQMFVMMTQHITTKQLLQTSKMEHVCLNS